MKSLNTKSPLVQVQIFPGAQNLGSKQVVKVDKKKIIQRMTYALSLIQESKTSVNICFSSAAEMKKLNFKYRSKNKVTDVLSFYHEPMSALMHTNGFKFLGDIVICLEQCLFQAKEHKHSLSEEVEMMGIHGLVHLSGFDHERSAAALRVMNGLEKSIQLEVTKKFGKPLWCSLSSQRKAQ